MCITETRVFTFSNRRALGRLLLHLLKDYGFKSLEGKIYVITDVNRDHLPNYDERRDYYTFAELGYFMALCWLDVSTVTFPSWNAFKDVVKEFGINGDTKTDLFGKITVEIR